MPDNSRRSIERVVLQGGVAPIYKRQSPTNISVIMITQKLFHLARYCTDISLNAKYILLLMNTRHKNQFTRPARQVITRKVQIFTRRILRRKISARLFCVRFLAGYGQPTTVPNQHISGRGTTQILYSLK